MKSNKFQLVLIGIFATFFVIGMGVFAFGSRGGSATKAVYVSVWGTMPSQTFNAVFGTTALSKSDTIKVEYTEKITKSFDEDLLEALAT